jgi:fucose permease
MVLPVAILAVFVLGIVFSLIGAVKLKLSESLGLDDAKIGGLITTLMFTCMIVVLAIGPLVDAWGHKPFAILGFLLSGLAIYFFTVFKSYKGLVFSCVILGIGGMCVNTVGNTLLPKVLFGGANEPAALNLGNMFFGLGAFLTPFLAGFLLQRIGFSKTVTIVALVAFLPVIAAFVASDYPALPPSGYQVGKAVELLANPVVLISALALFCYIGLEASMGGWITTYLTATGMTAARANSLLSAFWISLMVARLITAGLVTPAIGVTVIATLSLVTVVTILIMVVTTKQSLAAFAVIATGLAFGPIFPTIVGVTFSRVAPELSGSVFAIIFAVGLLGASTIPAAIGIYSRGKTIQKSLKIAMVTAIALFAISLVMKAV